jgi:hypothetical protein
MTKLPSGCKTFPNLKICYTVTMQSRDVPSPRKEWTRWVEALENWGLRDFTAWVLEAAGPLSLLGAQFLYMGQPFLRPLVSADGLGALAQILEDHEERQAFVGFLREAV